MTRHVLISGASIAGNTAAWWLAAHGCRISVADAGANGPTAGLEILRGDPARPLHEPASRRATYRFGDHVTAIEDGDTAATVTFASGAVERFDAVIVAEGVGSSTREMIFPGENRPRSLGLTFALGTIPRVDRDDRSWRLFDARAARVIMLPPTLMAPSGRD